MNPDAKDWGEGDSEKLLLGGQRSTDPNNQNVPLAERTQQDRHKELALCSHSVLTNSHLVTYTPSLDGAAHPCKLLSRKSGIPKLLQGETRLSQLLRQVCWARYAKYMNKPDGLNLIVDCAHLHHYWKWPEAKLGKKCTSYSVYQRQSSWCFCF